MRRIELQEAERLRMDRGGKKTYDMLPIELHGAYGLA
jgi:hypothetical protein